MSDVIVAKIKALQEFQGNTDAILTKILQKKEKRIIRYNHSQLQVGETANGQKITPLYTAYTRMIKKQKRQPFDRVTLFDEGDFYKSFKLIFRNNEFEISATDKKTANLQKKYGKEILGLNDTNIQALIDLIRLELIKEFKNKLQ